MVDWRPWVLAWIALFALFAAMPELDIMVTRWFVVDGCAGGGCPTFPLAHVSQIAFLREMLRELPIGACVAVLLFEIARKLRERLAGRRLEGAGLRGLRHLETSIVVAALAGPLLLVAVILKPFVGRPRPDETVLFGGELPFVAVGRLSEACSTNCSFVSGEAAGIAMLIPIALLAPPRWRRLCLALAAVVTAFTAMLRVAFGRHYISDVLLGLLSTLVVFAFAYRLLGRLPTRWMVPALQPNRDVTDR